MNCSTPGLPVHHNSWSPLKLMSIESVMPSNYLILCRPLHPLPSISPSIRVFFSESALHIRRPKYWSFSFSISPSNEYSGLISFRIDWFDLLFVQRFSRVFSSTTPSLLNTSDPTVIWAWAMVQTTKPNPFLVAGRVFQGWEEREKKNRVKKYKKKT